MGVAGSPHFLDRPAARVLALACFALSVAALVYINRDRLFGGDMAPAQRAGDPLETCMRDRAAVIDGQVKDGTIRAEQAALFKNRLEALCAAQLQKQPADTPGLPRALPGPPLPVR